MIDQHDPGDIDFADIWQRSADFAALPAKQDPEEHYRNWELVALFWRCTHRVSDAELRAEVATWPRARRQILLEDLVHASRLTGAEYDAFIASWIEPPFSIPAGSA